MSQRIYDKSAWRSTREQILSRDGDCTYSRLLGGECSGPLHVHHLNPSEYDPFDPDGLITVCEVHHPKLEAIRRAILSVRGWKRCNHVHRTRESREQCERRLNAAA
jgi:hypothetical protein